MIYKQIKEKGILAKLIEKGIEIVLKKECKKIDKIEINIFANSIQIIKGLIRKIHIMAENINYKDLLFDEVELEANDVQILFRINNKELSFGNKFKIKFKISLSAESLKTILLSDNWSWICNMIIKELSTQDKLENIQLKNGQILITTSSDVKTINKEEKIDIKTMSGKLYLENIGNSKSIIIPIEDKVFITNVNIKNNLINVSANSSISF